MFDTYSDLGVWESDDPATNAFDIYSDFGVWEIEQQGVTMSITDISNSFVDNSAIETPKEIILNPKKITRVNRKNNITRVK